MDLNWGSLKKKSDLKNVSFVAGFQSLSKGSSEGTTQRQASADQTTGETFVFYEEKSIVSQVPPWLGTTEQLSSLEAVSPGSVSDSLTPTTARAWQQRAGLAAGWAQQLASPSYLGKPLVLLVPAPGKQLLTTCKSTAQGHRLVASGQTGKQRTEAEGARELESTVRVGFASFPAQKQGCKISVSVP